MILVDSNILMYAAGAAHPNKRPSLDFLTRVAQGKIDAVLDAEVLQEILHRYRALNRWTEGSVVYDMARKLFPVVISVTTDILDQARSIMDATARVSARDAVHAAVVEIHGLEAVCSYDRDFDELPQIKRIEP